LAQAVEEDVYKDVDVSVGPQCHSPGCRGYGSLDSGVVFIGIAPGKDEVRTGRPLTGPSGRIFNNILKPIGLPRTTVYCTNLICWWKDDPSPEEAARCASRLHNELLEVKPKLIVLLGKIVTEIFTGRDFGKIRGAVQWNTEYNCYVMATNHPAALLHALNSRQTKGKEDTTIYDIVRDLRKIEQVLQWAPGAPEAQIRYRVVNSSEQAQNVLDNLPRSDDWPIAIDVETKYDKDDDDELDAASERLLCVGVGTDNFCWVFTP
jgi:uracil-DNA glycosylase